MLSYLILDPGTFSDDRLAKLLEKNGVTPADTEPTFPIQLFSIHKDLITRFRIPWYYFGGGSHLLLDNRTFPFSFTRPQNTVEPGYYSESFIEWSGDEGQKEVNIPERKASGKRWKELLAR